jgi:membrane associated rhomboid family serine protease
MLGNRTDSSSVVFNLILINVGFFLARYVAGFMFNISLDQLLGLYYPGSPYFKPVQLVSHMFMHGSLLHLFSNMYAVWIFGSILEQVWGPKRFLLFYFFTGFGAELLHLAVMAFQVFNFSGSIMASAEEIQTYRTLWEIYSIPTVGASGAVFGILIGFGMLFPNTELMLLFIPVPIKAKFFVGFYVIWELYRGLGMEQSDNVAHFAHLGGALFGYILVKYWKNNRNFLF